MIKIADLGEYVNIKTGKLDANASSINGKYPFFTCSNEPLKINNYSYDCECVLVAGNGDLNVKYYNGKFDAYQRTYIIESKDKNILNTKYLYYLINANIERLRRGSIGGVIKYIKLGNLTNIKLELTEINKQNQIVKELDKVQQIIDLRKKQIEELDKFIKSQFVEMFDNKDFIKHKIKDFAIVKSGGTPDRKNKLYWDNGIIPWIKTGEIKENLIIKAEEHITDLGLKNSSATLFEKGSILIAMYGQGTTRGRCALLGIDATTNQACAGIKIIDNKILNEFLFHYLQLKYEELRDLGLGGVQPNLNSNMIKEFKVTIPPIDLQNKFIKIANQMDKQKIIIEKSLKETEELQESLMNKYFG